MPLLHILSSSKIKYQFILLLVLAVLFVTVLTIWSMNRLSTVGQQIAQLEKSKSFLELENELLEKRIAEKKSLTQAEESSKQLGFGKISKIEYVSDSGLALNH
jgi:cell division protein FtsL